MPLALLALCLLTNALGAVTLATLLYSGFRSPETRFALVVTLLLVFGVLVLAPLALVRPAAFGVERATGEAPHEPLQRPRATRNDPSCLWASRHAHPTPRACGHAQSGLS